MASNLLAAIAFNLNGTEEGGAQAVTPGSPAGIPRECSSTRMRTTVSQIARVLHGFYGAKATKPTDILLISINEEHEQILSNHVEQEQGHRY